MNLRTATLTLTIMAAMLPWAPSRADTYPSRPIRIVVPTSAGGITDLLARVVANHIAAKSGGQAIVENRPGASGNLGMEIVARAAPDGYILGFANAGLFANPFLFKKMSFDPKADLDPVAAVGEAPQLLVVNGDLPVRTLSEFIALSKSKPGQLNYASAGVGSTPHLAGDQFARLAGLDMVHVAYRGTSPAITDVVRGGVQMISVSLGPVAGFVEAGRLRVLTVAAQKRVSFLPDVPTAAEAGLPGYEMTTWFGLFAPRGTPPEIVARLNEDVAEMLTAPEIRKRLADNSIEALKMSPGKFRAFLEDDSAKWEHVVRESGIHMQ